MSPQPPDDRDAMQFLLALAIAASGAVIGLSYFLVRLFT